MTRICVASSGLGHVTRGIEAWADDLARALAARGEDVILCKGAGEPTAAFERVLPCWTRESRKTVALLKWMPRSLGWRIGFGSGYEVEQSTFACRLIATLRAEQVDVLHVQDPHVAWLVQNAHKRGIVKTRTILAHGTEEPVEFQSRITYLQHLAPWHLEQARSAGISKKTWTTIPNFVDTDHFHPGPSAVLRQQLNIPDDGLVVLSAAAIKRHHKRVDYLVHEFRHLLNSHPDLRAWLVLAGGWEETTETVIAEAKQLLGDRVRCLVRFPRQSMADLYRAADLFTLASLKEMMPIALLEATATGLPCVVHQHPVMQWMVGAGGEPSDLSVAGRWAETVAPLLHDHQRRAEMGERAREHCVQRFSRDRVVDQIVGHYDWVTHHDGVAPHAEAQELTSAALT